MVTEYTTPGEQDLLTSAEVWFQHPHLLRELPFRVVGMLRPGLVSLLTTFLLSVPFALAQGTKPAPQPDPRNVDASAFGECIDLPSAWLFSPTDNPENASPTLDDRSWVTLSSQQKARYDFHHVSIGWFRMHVHLPPAASNVVLELDGTEGEYQAFANGVQIAGPPVLHATSNIETDFPTNYRIPQAALRDHHGDLVLALRVDARQSYAFYQPPFASTAHLVSSGAAPRDASYRVTHNALPGAVNAALALVAGLVALALYLAMRTRREYFGAALVLFLYSAMDFLNVISYTRPVHETAYSIGFGILEAASLVANIEFVRLVLSRRSSRLLVLTEAVVFLASLSVYLQAYVFGFRRWDSLFAVLIVGLWVGPMIVAEVLQIALLIPACRRRNVDALILLPLLCVSFIDDFWGLCRVGFSRLPHPINLGSLPSMHLASYVFSFRVLDSLFFCFGILLFLVVRAVRVARERARVGAEIESAQTMQQLLLSRSAQPTPGFDVDSVYLPASEVGGDFFLVSPNPHDGSLTVLVGDVSGKGLQAAMRVSMILGMLRREDSREPANILYHLNDALHAQGCVGFTTACCLLLQADGSFRVANAGHISPYVSGAEIETSPGLPLGLVAGQEYEETKGRLGEGDRIVLMSDGVVEARGKKGELYGFDRLRALTLEPAREIAATAQAFGQDDDITVLTLMCTA